MKLESIFLCRFKHLPHRIKTFFKRHSLLIPIVTAFITFMVVIFICLSTWFFQVFTHSLENTIYESVSYEAGISSEKLRSSLKDYHNLSAKISLNESLLSNNGSNSYNAYEKLKNYDFTSFKYSNLILYYKNTAKAISVLGTGELATFFPEVDNFASFLTHINNMNKEISVVSTKMFGASNKDSQLLYIHPISSQCFAIFTVNQHLLQQLISLPDNTLCVILNQSGDILWENTDLDIESELAVCNFASSTQHISSRLHTFGNEYLCAESSIGYEARLLLLTPVGNKLIVVKKTLSLFIFACFIILAAGVVALVVIIRGSYAPIHSLVKEMAPDGIPNSNTAFSDIGFLRNICESFSRLVYENSKNESMFPPDQLHALFVLRMICGSYYDKESLDNVCHFLNIDFPYESYCVFIILFDRVLSSDEQEEFKKKNNFVAYPEISICSCLSADGANCIGICCFDSSAIHTPKDIDPFVRELCACYSPITIGFGDVQNSFMMLNQSYIEARTALDYRLVKEDNTSIFYTDIKECSSKASNYPYELLALFRRYMSMWNSEKISESLAQIIGHIDQYHLSLQQVKCVCVEISSSFLQEVSRLGMHYPWHSGDNFDTFSIAEYKSIYDLKQKIQQFSYYVQQFVVEQNEFQNDKLIKQCFALLEQNVSNSQFSLSELSDITGITSQTLRKKFKDNTGETLSNYLKELRIKRAKDLLVHTDIDLEKICSQCGFINLSSFIRLFRDETGYTPGKYRSMHSNNRPSEKEGEST